MNPVIDKIIAATKTNRRLLTKALRSLLEIQDNRDRMISLLACQLWEQSNKRKEVKSFIPKATEIFDKMRIDALQVTHLKETGVVEDPMEVIYRHGVEDHEKDLGRASNPFPPESAEFAAWDAGWNDANNL
jgi:hypothetical protein